MTVTCEECSTAFAPDLPECPHCQTPNPALEAHLAGVTSVEETEQPGTVLELADVSATGDVEPAAEQPDAGDEPEPAKRRGRTVETAQLPDTDER